jgi:hypothetical protein
MFCNIGTRKALPQGFNQNDWQAVIARRDVSNLLTGTFQDRASKLAPPTSVACHYCRHKRSANSQLLFAQRQFACSTNSNPRSIKQLKGREIKQLKRRAL